MSESQRHIPGYPKVYALGHPAIADLLLDPVVVQEKIDGSQFSFADFTDGGLMMRSKGAEVYAETKDKLFRPAVDTVLALYAAGRLRRGYIYRGETLTKPHHNTVKYGRVPRGNIILFDVETPDYTFFVPYALEDEAERLGLECVPTFDASGKPTEEDIRALLETESVLGGSKVEGVVLKNHGRFGRDGKFLAGKYVSEAFKEVHGASWKGRNPNRGDIIERLGAMLSTDARYSKAVQHLRERGELEQSPRDIGKLINEVREDVLAEERDRIIETLLAWAWPQVSRKLTGRLPSWYKDQLLAQQFQEVAEERPEGACPNCGEPAEAHTWAGSTGPEPSDEWDCPVPTPEKHTWVR